MFLLNKNIVILCLFLLLLNGVFAENVEYNFGYIKINRTKTTEICNFFIDKMENCIYILTFEHYGNINESMKVEIYLNENLIYIIDDSNDGSSRYKKNVSIDITSYLENGSNTLMVEGKNLDKRRYYVLNKTSIICKPSTTVKVPVSIPQVILSSIMTIFISLEYLTNNYRESQ